MVNKRKMIDADKHFSFVYKLSHNKELLSYFVTNLSGKIVNYSVNCLLRLKMSLGEQ